MFTYNTNYLKSLETVAHDYADPVTSVNFCHVVELHNTLSPN